MAVYSLIVDSDGTVVSTAGGPPGIGFSYALSGGDSVSVDCTGGNVTLVLPSGRNESSDIVVTKSDSSSNAVSFSGSFRAGWNVPSLSAQNDQATFAPASDGQWISTSGGSGNGAYVPLVENVDTANSGSAFTVPDPATSPNDTTTWLTLTANCTLTFPTAAKGKSFTLGLVQDATGSRTVTWPGSVKWAGGTAPTLTTTAAKTDVISFLCGDGTNWLGFVSGQNF